MMRITYSGAAYRMYAEENPDGCQAVEMAPGVWQIYIEDYEDSPAHGPLNIWVTSMILHSYR